MADHGFLGMAVELASSKNTICALVINSFANTLAHDYSRKQYPSLVCAISMVCLVRCVLTIMDLKRP